MRDGTPESARATGQLPLVVILTLSAAILGFLFWLIYFQEPSAGAATRETSVLPAFNALCNAVSATCVATGIFFIKRGNRTGHGVLMVCALIASTMFLGGYITYHHLYGDTRFIRQDWIRPLYLFILASHILLSMAVVPLILSSIFFAIRRRWNSHRRVSRWTYPVWLYVSVTGVIVFFMLRYLNVPLG